MCLSTVTCKYKTTVALEVALRDDVYATIDDGDATIDDDDATIDDGDATIDDGDATIDDGIGSSPGLKRLRHLIKYS